MHESKVRAATIKDVAQLAGVSISTVSRVVNQQGGVSPKLTKQIERAIAQLHYRSNNVARALRRSATNTLGFIVPSVENPAFGVLSKAIESTANRHGFFTILCNTDGEVEKEVHYMRLLIGQQVDGIIFNAMGLYDERLLPAVHSGVPVVVVGRKIPGIPTTNVTVDNREGACMAVNYMISTGLSHIAFIFGLYESATALDDRFAGYRDALVQNGIPYDDRLVINALNDFESGAEAVQRLIDKNIHFDGIFASNDLIALSCIKQLDVLGIRIPDQVSVMGYDMIPFSQMRHPQLSTVNSNLALLGTESIETLLRIIETGVDGHTEKTVKAELVLGGTTR